jgi:hypothetical protein
MNKFYCITYMYIDNILLLLSVVVILKDDNYVYVIRFYLLIVFPHTLGPFVFIRVLSLVLVCSHV